MAARSLRNSTSRRFVLERLGRLSPLSTPQWGTMNPALLLPHLARGLRRALGEIPTEAPAGRLGLALRRLLFVHLLPWPRGRLKAPPGAFDLTPGEWEADRQVVRALIERFATAGAAELGPLHPALGRMSAHDWDVLMYRHLDHHLRQFGV